MDPLTAEEMEENAVYFEQLAVQVQNMAEDDEPEMALASLDCELPLWRGMALIDLAGELVRDVQSGVLDLSSATTNARTHARTHMQTQSNPSPFNSWRSAAPRWVFFLSSCCSQPCSSTATCCPSLPCSSSAYARRSFLFWA